MNLSSIKTNLKSDLLSGFVVFLVALPLCLGIALASGAPLFSGLIAGIVGGLVIGSISKSPLSVSGPAAGLTAICLSGISSLGSFELFLLATMLAGGIQLLLALIRAGSIAYYFPSNVIKGMLTGIGVIIILKQLPYLLGYNQGGVGQTSSASSLLDYIHPGAALIGLISLAIIVAWDKFKPVKLVPGALVAVVTAILINQVFILTGAGSMIAGGGFLVNLPVFDDLNSLAGQISFPDFSGITNKEVWIVALTIGIVASLESLLTIEATDRLDPDKRVTPTNRELLAQGMGNITSGLIGGLPLTSVIVRSSANINSGAKSKMSTIFHGFLLLTGALFFARYLNHIPLAALAAVLVATGFKLSHPTIFKNMFSKSKYQWLPFIVTVAAVVLTDLLNGVLIGMAFSILSILIGNIKHAYYFKADEYKSGKLITLVLAEEVSFLNKAAIRLTLAKIPSGSRVVIDASHSTYIDHDVLEIIREFQHDTAPSKNISLILKGFKEEYEIKNNDHVYIGEIPEPLKKLEVKKEFITQRETLDLLT